MSSGIPVDFQAYLQAEEPSILDELTRAFAARGEHLPWTGDDARAQAARRTWDMFFTALEDPTQEAVQRFIDDHRHRPIDPRMKPEDVYAALALLHGILVQRARAAAEAGVPGVWDGVERMAAAHGLLAVAMAAMAQRRLQRAHDQVKGSEERYRRLFERAPVMMHTMDENHRILAVTDRWVEDLGYTREEAIGSLSTGYMTEEMQRNAGAAARAALQQSGSLRDVHFQIRRKSGEVRDVLCSAVLERAEGRSAPEVVLVTVDVTEQMRVERALRDSEERYRSLVEQSPMAIMVHQDGIVRYVNKAAVTLFRARSPEDLLGASATRIVHPDFLSIAVERMRRTQQQGHAAGLLEEKLIRLDGSAFYGDVSNALVPYDGGIAVQVTFTDVTERKLSAEALKEATLKEERIQAQERMLRELSTPLIPIHDGIVVMPLVGAIDEVRAARIMETLLEGINTHRASFAILDVTGVPEAPEGVAEGLVRAAQAARLLGAQVVLTGLRPSIAQALVQMGVELSGLSTYGTLQSGVAHALQMRAARRQ